MSASIMWSASSGMSSVWMHPPVVKAAAGGGGGGALIVVGLVEHDPVTREEAAVQATILRSRVQRGGEPPRAAHGAEADVIGDVIGEGELRDHAGRPIPEVRLVPCASFAIVVDRAW